MTPVEWIALPLVAIGCAFFAAGTAGLLRFPDTLSRLHALTKADNLGLGFICLGLAVRDGTAAGVTMLAIIWLLAMFAGTVSAFLIARWQSAEADREDT
ncbi:MAG: monovalent cation/H(+) antiporter subunit G [Halioglobus sp.]|nr:monovalent cation/H(+) antiporter subunit G [Halioglobus sp.]